MTNAEAIEHLKNIVIFSYQDGYTAEAREALKIAIKALEAQEESLSEWCTDCSEYDHERHCCPRFSRVIRETLKEAQETCNQLETNLQPNCRDQQNGDVISRQAAIDALDKQFWRSLNIPICKEIRNVAKETIKSLPSAQPEIVRCKDCKFANSLKIGIVCRNMSHSVTENDFCSRAERRTDG